MAKESLCCRVCLRKTKNSTKLTNLYRKEPPQLSFFCVFNVCTRLGASSDDFLPQYLCATCRDNLIKSFNFVQLAQTTDGKLRKQNELNNECLGSRYSVETGGIISFETSRDPLEETDEEVDHKKGGNGNVYDDDEHFEEDDNKPLKELFRDDIHQGSVKIVKRDNEEISVKSNSRNAQNEDSNNHLNMFVCDNNDDDDNLSNSPAEDVADFMISPEKLIFPQGRYRCEKCSKAYFTAVGLQAHGAVHLPKSEKVKKSRNINKRIKGEPNPLEKSHIESSLQDTEKATSWKFSMPESSKKFARSRQKLAKPKKIFPCQVCGKHMISASKLRYHMVMHTGERDYLCTICAKAYSTIYALKHHMRTHTGERPYECKFCGDKFLRPTTLKSHVRRHTGERPYGCDICGKRFIQHSSMTTHMKLNHMAKTIACPHCDKKYARQTDLSTHLLSHTGDKPFSCHLCPSRFIRQSNLNKHINQHHQNQPNSSSNDSFTSEGKTLNPKTSSKMSHKLAREGAGSELAAQHPTRSPSAQNIDTPQYRPCVPSVATENPVTVTNLSTEILSSERATILPALFRSGTMDFSTSAAPTHNRCAKNLNSPNQSLHFPSHGQSDITQPVGSQAATSLLEPQHSGRVIEDLNRWNWSSSNTT